MVRIRIKKRGQEGIVRLPATLMASAGLCFGQTVEVTEEAGRIIIRPIVSFPCDLDRMIDAMDPDSFPENIDFGHPQGGETW